VPLDACRAVWGAGGPSRCQILLLRQVRRHRTISASQLADELEVSVRTADRGIEALSTGRLIGPNGLQHCDRAMTPRGVVEK